VNLAFRENLAPRRGFRRGVGGARNDPGLSVKADWDNSALQGARYATWASHDEPWTRTTSTNKIDASQIMDVLRQSKRGVVVVGRLAPNDITEVAAFLDELHWPVIHADVRSGIRDVDVVVRRPNAVLEALRELRPDCVLQLGAAPAFAPATRAWLDDAFCSPKVQKIVVAPGRSRIDDDFATSLRVEAPPYMIARALYGQRFPSSKLLKPLLRAGIEADRALHVDGFSEPSIAKAVTEASQRHKAGLFVSNSMPIRDCDRFGVDIRAEANRGLAGIDGVVATALGYAENHDSDTTYLLIGDQAMLHDAGSLRAVADAHQRRLRIVVVDNGGGGIFSFLPLASNPEGIAADEIVSEEDFETLFGATHAVDFVRLVEAHGLTAARASSASEFERLLDDTSVDVVVATPEVQRKDNVVIHRALEAPAVEAARRSLSHNLAYERFEGRGPPVILLHGLFGSREDLRPLQAELAGRDVVMVDLAGHGASSTEAGYSYDDQVDGLLALFSQLYDGPVDMVGYSLGARLALGCKRRRPDMIGKVVAVSARLVGLEGDEREARRRSDKALAARVRALKSDADWASFFDDVWYAEGAKGGLWGELRRSGVYEEVRRRRLAQLPRNAAASLERAGLGDQPDLRDVASHEDVLLVHGAHDERCAGDAAALDATVLPGGHALLDEAPDRVAAAVHGFLSHDPHHADEDIVVTASVVEDFSVATRKPRENAWAGASSETDAGAVEGAWIALGSASHHSIGEAAPCRGVHSESAADARAALRRCAAKLEHVTIPAAVKQLDGSLNRFLHDVCGADAEIPSVRFALETAVVGLVTRSPSALYASALGRGARGSVDVAALVDGEDAAPAFLPNRVVKLKAGVLEPERDAARVRDAVRKHYKVRVDANRRWSREQYEAFLSHLNGAPLDFVEEPPFSSSNIPAALDETLTETDWSPAFDEAEVLVAKPALIGLERTLALARLHKRVVASSCFEAGAGLAHVAALGAALSDDAQGLGTYAWLAEDPFAFEELLDDEGAAFDVGAGEEALRAFAHRVFEHHH
jgi:2-succinyl-5-enolpyruvyl-6-hydroxy-3-cyclohexene-1-carboxylate synthase/pimeloyl-ACP methyl ester carboxylesterase/L-alanine-DL-glutamate epimerase-like enolase superfamily enzyme